MLSKQERALSTRAERRTKNQEERRTTLTLFSLRLACLPLPSTALSVEPVRPFETKPERQCLLPSLHWVSYRLSTLSKIVESVSRALCSLTLRLSWPLLFHPFIRKPQSVSTMPLSIPPELKKITPFVRRAEELDRDKVNPESRLVAYYCRQYAVHVGIPLAKSPEGKQCLGTLLGDLETEKVAMSNFTRDESKFLCRTFSDKIFDKADLEDRMGEATKTTARTFYASATFYEMLQQFYEEDEESEEWEEEKKRTVYAKWKATDILKAIREGREPAPGGYGEEEAAAKEDDDSEKGEEQMDIPVAPSEEPKNSEIQPPVLPPPVETVEEEDDDEPDDDGGGEAGNDEGTEVGLFGPPPAYPGEISQVEPFVDDNPPPSFNRPPIVFKPPAPPAPKPPPPLPAAKKTGIFGMGKKSAKPTSKVSKAALADAVELTSFALAALEGKDVELGATRLKQALEALGR